MDQEEKVCTWSYSNNSFMGFREFEYNTSCNRNYDADIIRPINPKHCPNCGGKIKHSK
jgi:hypothetical protein